MATLLQVRNYVDQKLSDLWDYADARQTIYASNHGRYWQGLLLNRNLRNHLPVDPTVLEDPTEDDEVSGIAGSHEVGWKAALPALPASLPCAFQADEFLSPSGIGWTLTVWVKYNGTIYTRSRTRHEDDSLTTEPWSVYVP